MHRDAPAIPAKLSGVSLFRQIFHGKTWKRALLVGVLAGMAVGDLNLAAAGHDWPVAGWFDALEIPLTSLMDFSRDEFDFLARFGREGSTLSLVVMVGYWIILGLLLALTYTFIRTGGIQRIRHDRVCRRALVFGTGAGIFLGGANFLAMLNEVDMLTHCFDFLDRPGVALVEAADDRIGFMQHIPQSPAGEGICLFVATMAYWIIVGFLPAMLFCVVRALKMKSDVGDSGTVHFAGPNESPPLKAS